MENIPIPSAVVSKPLPTENLTLKELILGLVKLSNVELKINGIDLVRQDNVYTVADETYETPERAVESFCMCLELLKG